MKFNPRLISTAVRSRFDRSLPAPPALANAPFYPALDAVTAVVYPAPAPFLRVLLFWAAGAGLATIYFIWFFADLLPHTLR